MGAETSLIVPEERHPRPAPAPAVPAIPQGANLLDMIAGALNRGLPIEYMDKLIEMKERLDAEEARRAYAADMAPCKAEMPPIDKDAEVDYTSGRGRVNYRHESIGNVFHTCAPVLGKYGFSHDFNIDQGGDAITVTCIITHRMGHTKEVSITAGPDTSGGKNPIQEIESTISYLKRSTFKLAIGVAARDEGRDDGRRAGPPGDGAPIDAETVKGVRARIAKIGADESRALRWASAQTKREIERIEDIPAKYGPALIALLDQQIETPADPGDGAPPAAGAPRAPGPQGADGEELIAGDDLADLRKALVDAQIREETVIEFAAGKAGRPIAGMEDIPIRLWIPIMGKVQATQDQIAADQAAGRQGSMLPDDGDLPI